MAIGTREMRAAPPRASERAVRAPGGRSALAALAASAAPAPRNDAPALRDAPPATSTIRARPARQPDYDAPTSPWPLFLYLVILVLAVNAAFVWAGLRAAGA